MNSRIFTNSFFNVIWFWLISDKGHFREKITKSYMGWIRKNPRIHPSYHFRCFPSKAAIQASRWNFWSFPEFNLVYNQAQTTTLIKNAIGRKIFADYGPEMDVKWQLVQSIGKILQRDKFATVDEISKLKLSRNFCLRLLAEQKLLLKDNEVMPNQNQDEFFI